MKAESDHDTIGNPSIYGSLTQTATSLYTPNPVQLLKVYGDTEYRYFQGHNTLSSFQTVYCADLSSRPNHS